MKFYMWSGLHYFMMISPFVLTLILYILFSKKDDIIKRRVGIILSFVAVLLLVGRNIELFILRGYVFDFELIPLHVCHFANFVLLYAFYKRSDTIFGFAFLFNLGAAFLSLVFADGLANYDSIFTIRGQAYIFGHILIVSLTLYAYFIGFIVLDFNKFKRIALIIFFTIVSSVFINNIFRLLFSQTSNYFYTHHPESGTPLDIIYDLGTLQHIGSFEVNIVYVSLLIILGLTYTYLLYNLAFVVLPEQTSGSKDRLSKVSP